MLLFFIQSANLCLLFEVFRPINFSVIFNMVHFYFYFSGFGAIPGSAQDLLLTLCFGVIPGGA